MSRLLLLLFCALAHAVYPPVTCFDQSPNHTACLNVTDIDTHVNLTTVCFSFVTDPENPENLTLHAQIHAPTEPSQQSMLTWIRLDVIIYSGMEAQQTVRHDYSIGLCDAYTYFDLNPVMIEIYRYLNLWPITCVTNSLEVNTTVSNVTRRDADGTSICPLYLPQEFVPQVNWSMQLRLWGLRNNTRLVKGISYGYRHTLFTDVEVGCCEVPSPQAGQPRALRVFAQNETFCFENDPAITAVPDGFTPSSSAPWSYPLPLPWGWHIPSLGLDTSSTYEYPLFAREADVNVTNCTNGGEPIGTLFLDSDAHTQTLSFTLTMIESAEPLNATTLSVNMGCTPYIESNLNNGTAINIVAPGSGNETLYYTNSQCYIDGVLQSSFDPNLFSLPFPTCPGSKFYLVFYAAIDEVFP